MTFNEKSLKNLEPIKPGHTRNPNGRPKGKKTMSLILKELLNKNISYKDPAVQKLFGKKTSKKISQHIMEKVLTKAIAGDEKFVNIALDRAEGKPIQVIKQQELPSTNEDAFEHLKKVADQEGITIEELCEREGVQNPED